MINLSPLQPGGVSPLVQQWLDFTTQPARTNLRIGLRGGVAANVFDGKRVDYASVRMDGPTVGLLYKLNPVDA
jgi:hypothetical protein